MLRFIAEEYVVFAQIHLDSAKKIVKEVSSQEKTGISHFPCNSAIYLAGYAIELILKSVIAKKNNIVNGSELKKFLKSKKLWGIRGHDLNLLLLESGLHDDLMQTRISSGLRRFRMAWKYVIDHWTVDMRYEIFDKFYSKEDASIFIAEIEVLVEFFKLHQY